MASAAATDASGGLFMLALGMVVFVGSHLLLSARPLRAPLVARLGERSFRIVYSVISLGLLFWVARAYGSAPVIQLWLPPIALKHVSLSIMPLACILVVAGVSTPSPMAIGFAPQSVAARGPVGITPIGITKVTRHPVMWGIALWGVVHLLANGDAAGMILFGGITLLALVGARAQDGKRRGQLGAAWDAYAAQTSYLPFAALLAGRTRLRWSEIGWRRLVFGLALYAVLLRGHPDLFGVSPLPL